MSLTVNENEYGLTVSETPTHSLTVSGTSAPLTIASDDLTLTVSDTPTSLLTVSGSTDPSITVQDNNILLTIDQSTGSSSSANPFNQSLNTTDSPTFAAITVSGTVDGRDLSVDGTKLDGIAVQANKYVHPSYPSRSVNTSGASVLDTFTSDVAGHVTSITTRTLTLADLGYTGAADANKYVLPTSFTARNINTSGAHVLDTFTSDTSGRVTGITTRPLLLADIGYTGATNADVTPSWVPSTNPNYLTAASTDLDSRYYTETETNQFLNLKLNKSGGQITGNITMSGSETVDGRDLSVDGSKLDGISAGADVTPSWVPSTNPNYLTAASTDLDSRYYTETETNQFLNLKANKLSPVFTGIPAAPTATAGTNTTQLATTAFVGTAVAGLVDSSPTTLDTLNELAEALGDDANFSTTVTNSIATKLPLAGGQMTGNITMSGSETVDGRDLSVDGSKLDGISAGADVTPSWVPSTNPNYLTASSTDLDSRYYTETETNQFLNLKLNKSGGQITGNITMSGSETVDGRDLSVDGSKLDGISAGADVTPSWVPSTNPNYLTASSTDLDSRYYTETETNQFLNLKANKASPTFTGTPVAPNLTLTALSTYSGSDVTALMITSSGVVGERDLGTAAFSATSAFAASSHTSDTSNPHSVTKTQVGLGNVTNESKATMFASPVFTGTVSGVSKTHVGLGNVTNESKSTMFASPTFTGIPTAPTPSLSDNNTNIATTEYVKGQTIAYSSLSGKPTIPSGNQIIDWTADQGSTDIHVNNLPTIPYSSISGTPAASQIVDWTVDQGSTDIHADNISEASVTQHQGDLSITESQISDLGTYLTAASTDLDSRYYTETETNQFLNLKANLASPSFTGNVIIGGNLTVNGTTTTINSTTVQVDDKNIELGTVATPTDATADGGGITLKGATDKTLNWINSTDSWTSNQTFSAPNLTLTNLSTYSGSDVTALMINGGNVVGKRDLGTNAFNSTSYLPLAGGTLTGDLNIDLSSAGTYFTGGSGSIRQLSITSGTNISAHALHTFNIASSNGKYEFDINGATELSLDSSSATFAGAVTIANLSVSQTAPTTQLLFDNNNIDDGGGYNIDFKSSSNDTANRFMARIQALRGSGAISSLGFFTETGSALTRALLLDSSQNATFAGNITLAGPSNEIIKSNGSIRLNIDSNADQSDRIFIVSTGANSELFRVDESGNGTFAGSVTAPNLNLTNLSTYSGSDATALMINGGNVVGKRALGTNAFNSTAYLPLAGGTMTGILTFDGSSSVDSSISQSSSYLQIIGNVSSTTTGARLWVGTGTTDAGFYVNAAQHFFRDQNSNTRLYVAGGGNVGIGTTSPTTKFEVNSGNTNNVAKFESTDSVARIVLKDNAGEAHLNAIGDDMVFATSSSGSQRMRITSSGNVGIGTASPVAKLDVLGTSGGPTVFDYLYSTNAGLRIHGDESAIDIVGTDSGDHASTILLRNGNEGFGLINSPNSSALHFRSFTANADAFSIHSAAGVNVSSLIDVLTLEKSGNVGIGTTSPSSLLHLESASSPSLRIKDTTQGTTLLAFSQDSNAHLGTFSNHPLVFDTNSSERMRIASSGNVGIGTTSPAQKLTVEDTIGIKRSGVAAITTLQQNGSGLILNAPAGYHPLIIRSSGVEQVRFASTGNVGIGNPADSGGNGALDSLVTLRVGGDLTTPQGDAGQGTLQLRGYSAANNQRVGTIEFVDGRSGPDNIISRVSSSRDTAIGNGNLRFDIASSAGTLSEAMRIRSTGAIKFNTYGAGTFTGTVTQKLGVDSSGNVIEMPIGAGPVDGSGTANYLARWIDSDTLGIGAAYDNGTNVGIGTTGPNALLNVQGDSDPTILINAETGNSANSGKLAFAETDGGAHQAWMKYDGSANRLEIGTSQVSQAFVINRTDGNVGIGTTSPSTKLQISSTMSSEPTSNIFLDVDGSNTTGGGGSIIFGTSSSAGSTTSYNAKITGTRVAGGSGGDSSLGFWTTLVSSNIAPQERMTITKEGNVGIGTTSPTYKLQVNGGVLAGGKVTYEKYAGSLTTTGYAVAGLISNVDGASSGFTFTCFGHTGDYQRIVYSCYNASGTWNTQKVIDEGTDDFDVTASANASTITFTFKSRSGTKSYTPRVLVEAIGQSINNTYA